MEFYYDWKKSEKELIDDQMQKSEKAAENQKRINELNKECDALQDIVDRLSEEQKEMLKNVPRSKEEWDKFNETSEDLEEKEGRMFEVVSEISKVVEELPLSDEDFTEQWEKLAMEVMKRHHLNN